MSTPDETPAAGGSGGDADAARRCANGGWLVAGDELRPEPYVYYTGRPPVVGCNRLVCVQCGVPVRHLDARDVGNAFGPATGDAAALYDSPDPAASPLLAPPAYGTGKRAFFCRCNWGSSNGARRPADLESEPPWRCAGHPPGPERPDEIAQLWARAFEAGDLDAVDALAASGPLGRFALSRLWHAARPVALRAKARLAEHDPWRGA